MEASVGLAGQTAGLIDEVKPVADIISEMVSEFQTVAGRMGGMAQGF
jgi:enoyl-[acyl-carrier protein] reductase II